MLLINILLDILYIISLCLIQLLIFNQINFLEYINIHIHVLFLFIYPNNQSLFRLILFSFLMGFIIDFFMYTGGLYSSALTLTSYLKIHILQFIAGKNFVTDDDFSVIELSYIKRYIYILFVVIIYYFIIMIIELLQIGLYNIKALLSNFVFGINSTTIILYTYFLTKKNKS